MALGSIPPRVPTTLAVKPVLLTAVTLCRSHLESYLGLAFKAILWSLPIGLLFISLMVMMVANMLVMMPMGSAVPPKLIPLATSLAPAAGLFSLLLIPVSIYCFTKSLVCTGTIARLAYQDLAGKPESVQGAESIVVARQWSLLRVASQVTAYLLLVYFGLIIAGTIVGMMVGGIAAGGLHLSPQITGFIVYCLVLAIIFGGCLWFYTRWFTAEMPLVVSDTITGRESLVHNAALARPAHSQLFRLLFWTGLLTGALAWAINTLSQLFLETIPPRSPFFGLAILVSLGISLIVSLSLTPFWQAVKAIAYYRLNHATQR